MHPPFSFLISANELAANLDNPAWVIVDCRHDLADPESGALAYAQSHIPGARFAHLDRDLSGPVIPGITGRHPLPEIPQVVNLFSGWGITQNTQVIAYDDKAGGIAARLWWMLRWLGHDAVAVLDGGWQTWTSAGFPVTAVLPPVNPARFTPQPRPDWIADADKVDQIRQNPGYNVLDARAPERFSGEVEPIDPVAGHIPGAVNAPFSQNLENGRFKDPEILKSQFKSLTGDKPAEKIVFYCGSGVTACHGILAYAYAGLGDARLYPGSWSEWIADGSRPVVKE